MNKKQILTVLFLAAVVSIAGCGEKKEKAADAIVVTPTLTPTPTPEPISAVTSTPLPTSTPAPRRIGVKTSTSQFLYLSNNTENALREIFLKNSDQEDWGKNLIATESTVKASEQVQMFYAPQSGTDARYDMKIVDKAGNVYIIYDIELSDMESASLRVKDGDAYLSYLSLTSRKEMNTQNSYSSSSYDDSSDWDDSDDSDDSGNWDVVLDTDDFISYDDSYDDDYYYDDYDSSYDYDNDYGYDNGYDDDSGYYDEDGDWISYY
jgi:hypothetical protein